MPALALVLLSPTGSGAAPEGEPLRAFAAVAPHAALVNRVAGPFAVCRALVPPGADPHTYSPAPSLVEALSGAALYFTAGLAIEDAWRPRLESGRGRLRVVDLRTGIRLRGIEEHAHEPGEHHAGAEPRLRHPDPHIWLSPPLLKTQAATVRDALIALAPERRAEFEANCAALFAELDTLHAALAERLRPFAGRAILAQHAAFGYFTDAYALRQESIEATGKEPSLRTIAGVVTRARASGVGAILVQPGRDPRAAAAVGRVLGVPLVPIDVLAPEPMANLQALGDAVARALATGAPADPP